MDKKTFKIIQQQKRIAELEAWQKEAVGFLLHLEHCDRGDYYPNYEPEKHDQLEALITQAKEPSDG